MDETTFFDVNPGTEVTFRLDLYNDCVPARDCLIGSWMCAKAHGESEREIGILEFIIFIPPPPSYEW
jgi:hypothetical protein